MPHFVADHLASSLRSQVIQNDGIKDNTRTNNFNETTLQAAHLRSYPESVSLILNRYTHNEVIAEANAAIQRFMHPANITPLQYGKNLFAEAICMGNVYGEGNLNDSSIDGAGESVRYRLCKYRSTHLQTDCTSLSFQAQSLLAVHGGSTKCNQTPAHPYRLTYQQ